MFKKLFGKKSESEVVEKYKKDNVTLMSKVVVLESQLKAEKDQTAVYQKGYEEKKKELEEANKKIAALEADSSQKVTYAQARKVMTKAKLKEMRKSLEAVPRSANGFSGSVSVYDKKTKRLSLIQLTSKDQALEIVSKAEKGDVDIVI